MGDRILIAYASPCGSTAEIAVRTGSVLEETGAEVHVCDVRTVTGLEGYTAVVLGTAIRRGQPVREMRAFLDEHERAVTSLPNAVFSVGSAARARTPSAIAEAARAAAPLVARVYPVSVALFAGRVDPAKLGFPWRTVAVRGGPGSRLECGDWRDWDAIEAWASELCVFLLDSDMESALVG
jgi:menaquinone-dependent protoporphyrinogen oxidase